ncbi:MAG TPA: hypothetical protein VNX68_13425, partial [Nitrosopumilaceae archaeon]|nr:hypothetical protein [Nitrosopumilaceae archaeon]
FYHKKTEPGQAEKYEKDFLPYDPDHAFVSYQSDKVVAYVQYFVFGKVFQTSSYFIPKSVKK